MEGEVNPEEVLGARWMHGRCDVCAAVHLAEEKLTSQSFCSSTVVFVDDCFDFGLRDGSLPAFLHDGILQAS